MKTVKTYQCDCGEDFYEDDANCLNCGKPIDKSKLKDEKVTDIKYTKEPAKELYCETCGHINGYHLEGCIKFIPHNGECRKGNCPACPITHTRGSHSDDFNDTEPCYCSKVIEKMGFPHLGKMLRKLENS
jgi:hypothetical protein